MAACSGGVVGLILVFLWHRAEKQGIFKQFELQLLFEVHRLISGLTLKTANQLLCISEAIIIVYTHTFCKMKQINL